MPAIRTRTNTETVYAQLRDDILAGRYAPCAKLKFASLTERYGASVSVIREALTRLSEQGLVEAEPRIGFRVREVSVADLQALTEARSDIEALALRQSIERGDVNWEARLVAAHHRLAQASLPRPGDSGEVADGWQTAHADFHAALLDGSGNPWLLGIAGTLRDAAEFYRRLSLAQEPDRDVAGEHRGLLQAALARDPDAATALLREHYGRTADIVRQAISPHEGVIDE